MLKQLMGGRRLFLSEEDKRQRGRDKTRKLNRANRKANKIRFANMFDNKCVCCGFICSENTLPAFEAHHVNPYLKDRESPAAAKVYRLNGSASIGIDWRTPWDKLYPELKKCVLVCSNCHSLGENGCLRADLQEMYFPHPNNARMERFFGASKLESEPDAELPEMLLL